MLRHRSITLACVLIACAGCAPRITNAPASSPNPPGVDRAFALSHSRPTVWVNDRTHIYHYIGTRWYGKTSRGHYTPEAQAIADGDRPAENGQ